MLGMGVRVQTIQISHILEPSSKVLIDILLTQLPVGNFFLDKQQPNFSWIKLIKHFKCLNKVQKFCWTFLLKATSSNITCMSGHHCRQHRSQFFSWRVFMQHAALQHCSSW